MTRSHLPAVLAEIAHAAGVEAAWAIARAHGGTSIYFPRDCVAGHWLAELVGLEAARKICRQFSVGNTGVNVLIPLARAGQQKERMVRALEAGNSASEAASIAGMHERTAFRARKRLKDQAAKSAKSKKPVPTDDRQPKLL